MNRKKLFIQIPCLNEEETLPSVVKAIPHKIKGIDDICLLIIDDGSNDQTIEVAKKIGADFIVLNHRNIGLAKSFGKGIEACLFLGADIVVNTDGDNQYRGEYIAELVEPICENRADVVIGCRDIDNHPEFPWWKKALQKIGSKVVRVISGTDVPDTTSGFRAMNKKAMIACSFMSDFSYTLEMLIQAGNSGLKVDWVQIETNPKTRDSRLFGSTAKFIFRQLKTILAMYLFYRPMHFFGLLSGISFLISIILSVRIGYFLWFVGPELARLRTGSAVLLIFSSIVCVLFAIVGLLASVLSGLRIIGFDIRSRMRNYELKQEIPPIDMDIVRGDETYRWMDMRTNED